MSFPFRSLLLLLVPAALAGCGDNPTCVFTTGCKDSGGGGGVGSQGRAALAPVDGQWISNDPPEVLEVAPTGDGVHPDSPIVLIFDESMNEGTLEDQFEVVPYDGLSFLTPIAIDDQVLLAEGRVLVLFPAQPLDPLTYAVRLRQGEPEDDDEGPFGGGSGSGGFFRESARTNHDPPTDLTGQELDLAEGELIGDFFSVPATAPEEPAVVATFPREGDLGAGETTTVAVVLDRAVQVATVTDASFRVLVDGADPVPDPVAAPLTVLGETESRVLLWRSEDGNGVPVPLAADVAVEVTLSPTGDTILDPDGGILPTTQLRFDVAPFRTPLTVGLMSQPEDAIGIRNLTEDGDEDLELSVDLADASPGDVLELFLFGTSSNENVGHLIALRRQISLSGTDPVVMASLGLDEIDLVIDGDPAKPRFADGPLAIAVKLRRGLLESPLRLVDVDPATTEIEDPILDTTPPEVQEIELTSDVRDVVVSGVADDVLRSVEVSADDGTTVTTNGTLPAVLGSDDAGGFLAAPVDLGVLASGEIEVTVVGYDAAFNPSEPVTGTFLQRGAVGPGVLAPGAMLTVEAYDPETLAAVPNALVAVHADLGDGVNYPLTSTGTTGADGRVTLATDAAAALVLVTIDVAGRDLVTVHGVPGPRLSVPVPRLGYRASGNVGGRVLAGDPAIETLLPGLTQRLDDTRRAPGEVRGYPGGGCTSSPSFGCDYGPEPILPGRLGAQSFLAGDFTTAFGSFNPDLVLQAFCLALPLDAVGAGEFQNTGFTLPFLLLDASVVPEEKPDELDAFVLDATALAGVDLMDLDDDPETTGEPRVSVEALVPGLPGTVQVGMGLAFEVLPAEWTVRSARPGAVSPAGFFGTRGSVDPDLLVRCELRDRDGNVSGRRPRLSDLAGLGGAALLSPEVPVPTAPVPGGDTPGRSYDLRFPDTLPDATGFAGLYRVQIDDFLGRSWILWRPDPMGAGEVRVHVPDIEGAGGMPLADGLQSVAIAAYAWGSLDPSEFLWTDVEREQDLFAVGASFDLTQTP